MGCARMGRAEPVTGVNKLFVRVHATAWVLDMVCRVLGFVPMESHGASALLLTLFPTVTSICGHWGSPRCSGHVSYPLSPASDTK